jgi:AraC-like DNA-binding protein/predicted transcriptional regulator YdeE
MGYEFDMGDGGQSARLMRGVRFIERNIERPLSLAEVAAEAALSEYHFHRLFRARYGMAVMDYVRRRRLTRAAGQLLRTPSPIVEIAFDAGFESQAAFTRAFRRTYATTPAAYRSRGREVPWRSVEPLSDETLRTLPELGRGSPRLQWRDRLRVAGIEAELTGEGREQIPALWRGLGDRLAKDAAIRPRLVGLSDGVRGERHGLLRYMAGIRLGARIPTPAGLTLAELPAGLYLNFTFDGAPARLSATIDYLFGVWIPGSGQVLRQAPSFELYDANLPSREACRVELCFPVEPQ